MSKDSRPVDVRADPARAIVHRTGQEEEIPLPLAAHLTQPLQIQHLAQRHPPQRQDVLVQVIGLRGGPPLERGGIATHRGEVAVVEPVEDGLFLLQAGPALAVGGGIDGVFAQGKGVALLAGFLVVLVDEAGADEDDVADLDVAALGGGPDVDALSFAAGLEVSVGGAVGGVEAIGDVLRLRVVPVVEEEGAPREAVRGPVVDAVLEVGAGAVDVAAADAVVKGFCGVVGELVGKLLDARQEALCGGRKGRLTCMTEAVPLSTALGVQLVYVVVGYTLGEDLDLVREWLAMKARLFRDIEWQASCGLSQQCASLWTVDQVNKYSSGTTSPVLISAEAALILVGVSRFNLPM
jgi:hypothetical protein